MIDLVALASGRFEACAIGDRDLTATVMDQPGAMEFSEGRRDPGAPNAEHRRHEFVRHRHVIRSDAVAGHQQPAGAALLDRVEPVAGGGLRAQVHDGFGEAVHRPAQPRALVKRRLALSGAHAQRGSGELHDDLLSRCLAAEKRRHPDHSFNTDHPDFDRRAVRHIRQDRCQTLLYK